MSLTSIVHQATAGPVLDRIHSRGKIVLGYFDGLTPFSLIDEQRPVGYSVDLCLKIAEAVRNKLQMKELRTEFKQLTLANRFTSIMEGEADLECGGTTNNAERRKKVAFTIPHYVTGARYLVRADSNVNELADFGGKVLVSAQNSTILKLIEQKNTEGLLRIDTRSAPDAPTAVDMVESGQAHGFVLDDIVLFGARASRPNPEKLKVTGKFLTVEPLAFMFSRDDPEFKKVVDDEMRRLIRSREAYAIYERWFMRPIPPKQTSLNVPMNYLLRDFWKFPTDQVPD